MLQIIWVLPSLLGVALQYGTTNTGSRLFGYYIIGSFVGSVGQGFAFPGANVTGYTYAQFRAGCPVLLLAHKIVVALSIIGNESPWEE